MRIGLLGGSFDPPHVGHLLAAVDAYEGLSLDLLAFVPAATQPLKVGRAAAPAQDRLEMVRRMVAGDPRFTVDPVEIERKGLSYTVDTLADYARRYPGAELFFLAGADVLATFAHWREPARILAAARLVILSRAPVVETPDAMGTARGAVSPTMEEEARQLGVSLGAAPERAPMVLATRRVDVSSTEVRERVRTGKMIRGFVPEAVAEYVAAAGLYR